MEHEILEEGDYQVVYLKGEVDLFHSPRAREIILTCLANDRNLLVELSGVTYIDSSGVASLVEGYQEAKSNHLKFGLVSVSESAMNVLQLAHLDKVFPIYRSVSECLESDNQ